MNAVGVYQWVSALLRDYLHGFGMSVPAGLLRGVALANSCFALPFPAGRLSGSQSSARSYTSDDPPEDPHR